MIRIDFERMFGPCHLHVRAAGMANHSSTFLRYENHGRTMYIVSIDVQFPSQSPDGEARQRNTKRKASLWESLVYAILCSLLKRSSRTQTSNRELQRSVSATDLSMQGERQRIASNEAQQRESLTAEDSLPLLALHVLAHIVSEVTAVLLQSVHCIARSAEPLCPFLDLTRHVRQVAFLATRLRRRGTAFS